MTKRRKTPRQGGMMLTQEIRTCLEMGHDRLSGLFYGQKLSEEEVEKRMDALWKIHGAAVTRRFIEQFPGQRPRLWWKHDSPEPRPLLRPANGFAEAWAAARKQQRIEEQALLIRHDLLSVEEQAAIKKEATEEAALRASGPAEEK